MRSRGVRREIMLSDRKRKVIGEEFTGGGYDGINYHSLPSYSYFICHSTINCR